MGKTCDIVNIYFFKSKKNCDIFTRFKVKYYFLVFDSIEQALKYERIWFEFLMFAKIKTYFN